VNGSPSWLPTAAQWTLEQMFNVLRRGDQLVKDTDRAIVANNLRLDAMYERANALTGPQRDPLRSELEALGAKQVRVVQDFATWSGRWKGALQAIGAVLRKLGSDLPPGLGQLQLAPIIAGGVVAAIIIGIWAFSPRNRAIASGLDSAAKVLDSVRAGEITPDQAKQLLRSYNDTINRAGGAGDILGLEGALKAALPVVLVIAAIVLVPKLMPRRARMAA
jgi:hypothetical protein